MKEENAGIVSKIGPNLLEPPHILPFLMELLAGERPSDLSQPEQLVEHLATCHYCRAAVIFLLKVAQDYDRINNNPDKPIRDLLTQFEHICREAETREEREAWEHERMGAYAEAIVAGGQEMADQLFPDIAAHLRICPDCRSVVEATVADISESEEKD